LEAKVNKAFHVKVLEIFPRQRPYAGRLLPGKPAEKAGICNGDRFVAIEGVPLFSREQMVSRIGERADQPTAIRLLRDGQMLTVTVTPEYNKEDKAGRIGVELGEDLEIVRPGPTPLAQFADILSSMGRFVKAIVRHKETGVGVKSAMGPVGISYAWWAAIMTGGLLLGVKIGVLLNLNLAIVNLLPIPVLDGGHIIFATIEAIRRKPLNAKFVARIQTVFAVLLLGLMLYITVFSDLQRFLPNRRKPAANTVAPTNAP
jgi:regulator of sigma E protease